MQKIISRPPTPEYEESWKRIFGGKVTANKPIVWWDDKQRKFEVTEEVFYDK